MITCFLLLFLCGCGKQNNQYQKVYKIYKRNFSKGKIKNKIRANRLMNSLMEYSIELDGKQELECNLLECYIAAFAGDKERAEYLINKLRSHKDITESIQEYLYYLKAISYFNPMNVSMYSSVPKNLQETIEVWNDLTEYDRYTNLSSKITHFLQNRQKDILIDVINHEFYNRKYISCLYLIDRFKQEYQNDSSFSSIYVNCLQKIESS